MRLNLVPQAMSLVGLRGTAQLLLSRRRLRRLLPEMGQLRLSGYPAPFHYRRVATDKYVFSEVFLLEQYGCLAGLTDVDTIIDAGANIGTTSVFLLNAYPKARLIALEPDPGNFRILERNLSYYGDRAVALRKALWHRAEPLAIRRGGFRDGGEWSTQVTRAGVRDGDVDGITLGQLTETYGVDVIDLLKIDIEGAERSVLADSLGGCLDRVRTLAIELHDPECVRAFEAAVRGHLGAVSRHGEVTLWRHECADAHIAALRADTRGAS